IGSIPTVWDTTIVLQGKVGDYIVTARRKGADWYIGAMTDWTARELSIALDFLPDGSFEAVILRDGVNADRYASDYMIENKTLRAKQELKLSLAPGGGALLRLKSAGN